MAVTEAVMKHVLLPFHARGGMTDEVGASTVHLHDGDFSPSARTLAGGRGMDSCCMSLFSILSKDVG